MNLLMLRSGTDFLAWVRDKKRHSAAIGFWRVNWKWKFPLTRDEWALRRDCNLLLLHLAQNVFFPRYIIARLVALFAVLTFVFAFSSEREDPREIARVWWNRRQWNFPVPTNFHRHLSNCHSPFFELELTNKSHSSCLCNFASVQHKRTFPLPFFLHKKKLAPDHNSAPLFSGS